MLIYVVEDDTDIRELETYALKNSGYDVQSFAESKSFFKACVAETPHLVILDVMLPDFDGLSVLEKLRKDAVTKSVPVILVTAKGSEMDKVKGLDMGADDYLTKPFAMGELLARIRAMTRRKTEYSPNIISIGNLSLNRETFELSTENGSFRLGNKEFQLIEMLMSNPNRLISTEHFMEHIWGYETEAEINVVWVYISYLRKKLTSLGANLEIKATRGVGYTLEEIKC